MYNVIFKKGLHASLPTTGSVGTLCFATDKPIIRLFTAESVYTDYICEVTIEQYNALVTSIGNEDTAASILGRIKTLETAIGENGSVATQISNAIGALDVTDAEVAGQYVSAVNEVDGKVVISRAALPDYSNTYAAKSLEQTFEDYKTSNDAAVGANTSAINDMKADATTTTFKGIEDLITAEKTRAEAAEQANATAAANAMTEAQAKVASVTAGDTSVTVTGTATAPTVAVKLDPDAANAIKLGDTGLKVVIPTAAEYSVVKAGTATEGYAASYNLTKDGAIVGVTIDIPKDMVVESGSVVTDPEGQPAGTYIKLVLANATNDELFINVGNLIEYVTSGSNAGDMVVITVSDDHKVTATITDGTVTKAKLEAAVQTSLGLADTALQKADITAGSANGTIAVEGTDVAVTGLDTAAYKKVEDFDAAGAAAAVLGTDVDTADKLTVYGNRAYVDNALTWGSF